MDAHIRAQIEKLPPFAEKAQYVSVTLSVDSGNQVVEIIARSGRTDFVAQASSHDMYQSIDDAFEKLERQFARQHDKLVHGRAREGQKDLR
jgi:ribosomal subunit interface protein